MAVDRVCCDTCGRETPRKYRICQTCVGAPIRRCRRCQGLFKSFFKMQLCDECLSYINQGFLGEEEIYDESL